MIKELPWTPTYIRGEALANPFSTVWEPQQSLAGNSGGSMITFNNDYLHLGTGDKGNMWIMSRYITDVKTSYVTIGGYRGDATAAPPDPPENHPMYRSSNLELYAKGTHAIAATTPTTPAFDAPTFLGETLMDGLPHMVGVETWKSHTLRAKNAGDEYLNVQYGWLPFVSDLKSFAHAVRNSSQIINDYANGSGKKIRKRFRFPRQTATSMTTGNDFWRSAGSTSYAYRVPTSYFYSTDRQIWFSGCFQYFIPTGNGADVRFRRYQSFADKLLGLRLTPETVWNLTPWSWAVDWKTDIGDAIHNYSQLGHDGLVLHYGYIMEECHNFCMSQNSFGYHAIDAVSKVRLPATPFGFGVDMSALSGQQIAILAALGLSHS